MNPKPLTAAIAVVDDDESVRVAIASLLRSCGWSVRTYACGADLLSEIHENEICLVIADVQMPGMDGFSLLRKLGVRRPDIPAIFVTAYAIPNMSERSSAAGAIDFFTKPLDDVRFLNRVAEIAGVAPC